MRNLTADADEAERHDQTNEYADAKESNMATATATNTVEAKREAPTRMPRAACARPDMIPAVLYGAGKEPLHITVDPKQISASCTRSPATTPFSTSASTAQAKAMIVDWQYEPIKGALLHVDLKRIAMDKTLRVEVPIAAQGRSRPA